MGRYEDRLYIRSNIDYYKGDLDRCYSEMNSLKSDMERVRSNITYFSDEIESFYSRWSPWEYCDQAHMDSLKSSRRSYIEEKNQIKERLSDLFAKKNDIKNRLDDLYRQLKDTYPNR